MNYYDLEAQKVKMKMSSCSKRVWGVISAEIANYLEFSGFSETQITLLMSVSYKRIL